MFTAIMLSMSIGEPTFVVEDKTTTPQFTIVNRTLPSAPRDRFTATNGLTYERGDDGYYRQVASTPAKQSTSNGCGCTASANCGASFCKSKGGTGCPASCPVKSASSADATSSPLNYSIPQASSGGCASGNCPSSQQQSRPALFPRLRGW